MALKTIVVLIFILLALGVSGVHGGGEGTDGEASEEAVDELILEKGTAAAEIIRIIHVFSFYALSVKELDEIYTCMLERPFLRLKFSKEAVRQLKQQDGIKSCFKKDEYAWYVAPGDVGEFLEGGDVVKARVVAPGIGYLKITQWSHAIAVPTDDGTMYSDIFMEADIKPALQQFEAQGIESLIVDLRDNPGGALSNAVNFLLLFAPTANMTMLSEVNTSEIVRITTDERGRYASWRVIFLINKESASGSEIAAGIGRQWGMEVLGEPSFGKDLIQQMFWLSDGGVFQLTIARFEFADGTSPAKTGIIPTHRIKGDSLRAAIHLLKYNILPKEFDDTENWWQTTP